MYLCGHPQLRSTPSEYLKQLKTQSHSLTDHWYNKQYDIVINIMPSIWQANSFPHL